MRTMNPPAAVSLPLVLALAAAAPLAAQEAFLHQRVSLTWETKAELDTPESILFDDEHDLLFVSNVGGKPDEKDGNGFISLIRTDGEIHAQKWIIGLNAPKGLGKFKDTLYVTDIDQIVEIDLKTERIQARWTIEGAKFLNDIDIAADGTVYFSDSSDKRIHRIHKGRPEVFLDHDDVSEANGLFISGNELLVGARGRLLAIDLETRAIRTVIENAGYIDGLGAYDNKGRFIISDWTGKVYVVQAGEPSTLLIDTTPVKTNAADIVYIPRRRTLYVPTFGRNTIACYRVRL